MIIKNKLDRTFGPFGSSAGFFLLTGGLITTWFSVFGLLLVFAGAFTAFTSTSTFIDTDKKKIKHADMLFGIIPMGKWIDIESGMKLGYKKSHRGFMAYTRANQPVGIHYGDFRIILLDTNNKPIVPVKKFDSIEILKADLADMSSLLGLPVFKAGNE